MAARRSSSRWGASTSASRCAGPICARVQDGGRGGGHDQRAMHPALHPERDDQPRLAGHQREELRDLRRQHLAQSRARDRQRGQVGHRLPLARREQHRAIALAQAERDPQVVERQKPAGPLGHFTRRLGGIIAHREQLGDLQQGLGRAHAAGGRLAKQGSLHQQGHLGRDQRADLGQQVGIVLVVEVGPDAAGEKPDR